MNLIEFIGFIAMMLFLLHSSRNKRGNSDNTEDLEQAERLKEFLQNVDSDMQQQPVLQPKKEAPKWHPTPVKQKLAKPRVDPAWQEPHKDPYAVRKDAYVLAGQSKTKAFYLKKRLKTAQDMILWQEIMSPPVGLREHHK